MPLRYSTIFHPSPCHYCVLFLSPSCSPDEVRKAYRIQSLKTHPDKHPEHTQTQQTIIFQAVIAAYEVLGNADKKREYDYSNGLCGAKNHGDGGEDVEEDDGVNHGSGEDEVVEEGDSEKQGDWERQRPYGSQGTGKPSDRAWPWPSYKEDFQREWDRKNPDTSSREYRRPHRAEEFFGYFTQQHRSRYTYHSDDQFEQEQQRHRYQHHHHPHWQQQKQHKHTDTGPQTPTEKPEDKADKPKPTDTERRRIVNDKRQALSKCLMELSEASETKAHNMKAQAAGLQKFPKNQSPNEIRIWESHKKLAVRLAESILDLEEKAFNYRVQARRILKKIDETTRDFEEKMKLDKDDREYQESRYGPM